MTFTHGPMDSGRRSGGRMTTSERRGMLGGDLRRIEKQVWFGPLDRTLIVLKTRPRKECEVADNDHAVEIYVKVQKGRGWVDRLSKEDGWRLEGEFCMHSRDTWIDPDAPNAEKLMEILGTAMAHYLEQKTSGLDERVNPLHFLLKVREALNAMEEHLLRHQNRLVGSSRPGERLYEECGQHH